MGFNFKSRIFLCALGFALHIFSYSDANALVNSSEIALKYSDLELIQDSPVKISNEVLMMASMVSLDFQSSLIQRLVQYGIVVDLSASPATKDRPQVTALRTLKGVSVVDLDFETALWTQDRFFRFFEPNTGRIWLIPTIADSMNDDNAISGYELGVPLTLANQFPRRFAQLDDYTSKDSSVVSIDRGKGNLYFGEDLAGFVHGVAWRLAYGDGGDRLVTKSYVLIGQTTYDKTIRNVATETGLSDRAEQHSFLEKVLHKKIFVIGMPELSDSYLFHLDMFMTPIETSDGKLKVLFGSLKYTMNEIMKISSEKNLPTWANSFYWSKKLKAEEKLKAQLKELGIETVDMPIFFVEPEGFALKTGIPAIVSFNNGIFSDKTFFAAKYLSKFPDLNQFLTAAERIVESKFHDELDSKIEWIPGGESIIGFGGGVRCMAGVIRQADKQK